MMRKGLLWPTILTAAGLAVLIGLGTWQVQRLNWKQDLISRIEARTRAEPVSVDEALARWRATGDVEYLRVRLSGRFLNQDELHLYWISKGEAGWRVITPLVTKSGTVVLVDRGFVPDRLKNPAKRPQGHIEGPVEVIGLVREPETQGWFMPDNDYVANTLFWRDLEAMGRAVLGPEQQRKLAPFFVEAEAGSTPGNGPQGGVTRLDLHNRHLEYALTWYGLAAALIAVYVFFVRSRRESGQ